MTELMNPWVDDLKMILLAQRKVKTEKFNWNNILWEQNIAIEKIGLVCRKTNCLNNETAKSNYYIYSIHSSKNVNRKFYEFLIYAFIIIYYLRC